METVDKGNDESKNWCAFTSFVTRLVEEVQNNRAIGKGTCLPFAFESMLYHFLARW